MATGNIKASMLKPGEDIRSLELKNGHLRFSFKHLDLTHAKFGVNHKNHEYFCEVLGQLKELSRMVAKEIRGSKSKSIRHHPIKWEETTEPSGFSHLNSQLREVPACQFQIEKNNYGRVHGLFLDDIFFVVWLDPDHKLYP